METEKKVTALKEIASGRKDRYDIDPRLLVVQEGFNPRVDYGDIESLAQSIKVNGIKVPLSVCLVDGKVVVRSGHRRLRAVMLLIDRGEDIKSVPCIYEGKNCTEDQSLFDIILCNDGKNLLPIEEGYVYIRLMVHGYNQTEIAEKLGKTPAVVSNYLLCARAPKVIQNLIVEGKLKYSSALKILRLDKSEEEKINLCQQVIDATSGNGSGEVETKTTTTNAPVDDKTNTEKEDGVTTSADAKPQSQHQVVETVLPENRRTPNTRVKDLKTWIEDNKENYEDDAKFNVLQKAMDYVAGKISLSDLTALL